MSWRRSEWMSISTLVLLVGYIVWASQRVKTWDVVMDQEKGNDALDRRVTTLEVHIRDKDDEVLRALAQINKKLR